MRYLRVYATKRSRYAPFTGETRMTRWRVNAQKMRRYRNYKQNGRKACFRRVYVEKRTRYAAFTGKLDD